MEGGGGPAGQGGAHLWGGGPALLRSLAITLSAAGSCFGADGWKWTALKLPPRGTMACTPSAGVANGHKSCTGKIDCGAGGGQLRTGPRAGAAGSLAELRQADLPASGRTSRPLLSREIGGLGSWGEIWTRVERKARPYTATSSKVRPQGLPQQRFIGR